MDGRRQPNRTERDGPRSDAEALQAALARIAWLEQREALLRAALVAAGLDPVSVLAGSVAETRPSVPEAPDGETAQPRDPFGKLQPGERMQAKRLVAELASGPTTLRIRAASRLVELAGAAAVPMLVEAARGSAGSLRASLLEQLGRTGAAEALAEVRSFLRDENPDVRAAALEACARLAAEGSPELVESLRGGLGDADARVRRRAALCATAARGVDPGLLLVPLLSDSDRQVRRLACTSLGGTREPVAALALVGALLDTDPAVRLAAGAAAERLFGGEAKGIATLPEVQRGRAVAQLRAHVATNLSRLAPAGRLVTPEPAPPPVVRQVAVERAAAGAMLDRILDGLLSDESEGVEPGDVRLGHFPGDDWDVAPEVPPASKKAWEDEAASLLDLADELRRDLGIDAPAADERVAAVDSAEQVAAPEPAVEEPEPAVESAELIAVAEAAVAEPEPAVDSAEVVEAAAPVVEALEPAADAAAPAAAAEPAVEEPEPAPEPLAAEADEPTDIPDAAAPTGGPSYEAIEEALRAALRGCTDADLASELGIDADALAPAVEAHLAAGRLVRRGKKLFLP